MSASPPAFRHAYRRAFESYVRERSESTLRIAYELGRDAVMRGLGVLDLAHVHHDALLAAVQERDVRDDVLDVTGAGGDFFVESLSAFEMVQRGFREARERAALDETNWG